MKLSLTQCFSFVANDCVIIDGAANDLRSVLQASVRRPLRHHPTLPGLMQINNDNIAAP